MLIKTFVQKNRCDGKDKAQLFDCFAKSNQNEQKDIPKKKQGDSDSDSSDESSNSDSSDESSSEKEYSDKEFNICEWKVDSRKLPFLVWDFSFDHNFVKIILFSLTTKYFLINNKI